jgi:CubicO group peptidase (beta-lactamase class C family)
VQVQCDAKALDALFADLNRCDAPGLAVGIAIDGKPVYRKGFGLANLELPVVLSPTMRMRIGSTTKHFTCLAYLLLCEEGRASLDDSIGRYLPELHPVSRGVTVRQLMGHTSGLRDAFEICWRFSGTGHRVTSEELLALYRDIDDVDAVPGTAWSYNNGGYLMVGTAIERISGCALEEVFRERIFERVGMHDTRLRRFDSDFVQNSATLHMTSPGFEKAYLGTAIAGEGGVVSTVDDMLRWMRHMDAPVVGSSATWKQMLCPQTLANGVGTGYGLGLRTGSYRGVATVSHPGGVLGGNSQMLKLPELGVDLVVMSNRHDVLAMEWGWRVVDAILSKSPQSPGGSEAHGSGAARRPGRSDEQGATDVGRSGGSEAPGGSGARHASEAWEPLRANGVSGTFWSSGSGRVVQLFVKGGQQMASVDGFDVPVEAAKGGVLRPIQAWSFFQQSFTPTGDARNPTSLRMEHYGEVDELRATEPPTPTEIHSITGRYRSDATRSEVSIIEAEHGATLETRGAFGSSRYSLECLAPGLWRASSLNGGGVLSFSATRDRFCFSNPRLRRLPFRRHRDG